MRVAAKTQKGFTLIELMIVMGILGITLSLVGPLTVNQLDNMRRTQEREQLNQYLKKWRFQAQLTSRSLVLVTEGSHLHVWTQRDYYADAHEDNRLSLYEFEWLSFPQQEVHINGHGFWSEPSIAWFEDEREMQKRLFNRGVTERG